MSDDDVFSDAAQQQHSALSDPTALSVVTGATSGFGRAVALDLARRGRDICLIARSRQRMEGVVEQITAMSDVNVDVAIGDLSSIAEVDRLGREVEALGRPICLLVNNAGAVFGLRRRESVDHIEMTMALNHFGYAGLTRRLISNMDAVEGSRIVNVASDAYSSAGGPFDFDDWQATRRYSQMRQYGLSKLANILFTQHLASHLAPHGASHTEAVAWSPAGLTATRFAYGANPIAPLAMRLIRPFTPSTDQAVQSLLELCQRPLERNEHGAFLHDREIDPVPVATADDAARLQELTDATLDRVLEGTS